MSLVSSGGWRDLVEAGEACRRRSIQHSLFLVSSGCSGCSAAVASLGSSSFAACLLPSSSAMCSPTPIWSTAGTHIVTPLFTRSGVQVEGCSLLNTALPERRLGMKERVDTEFQPNLEVSAASWVPQVPYLQLGYLALLLPEVPDLLHAFRLLLAHTPELCRAVLVGPAQRAQHAHRHPARPCCPPSSHPWAQDLWLSPQHTLPVACPTDLDCALLVGPGTARPACPQPPCSHAAHVHHMSELRTCG